MSHALADDYLQIAFQIDRHFPGFIDAYFGDPTARERALAGPKTEGADLAQQARDLVARIQSSDLPANLPEQRRTYLEKQTVAMETIARKLAGEEIPYEEEVERCFDIVPERIPDTVFEEAIAELGRILPGSGDVLERMTAFREDYALDRERARTAIDLILEETRARTRAFVDLPDEESVEIVFVEDKPWRGYNWYLGNARSRVEINTDVPIHAHTLVDLVAHESYPGHHTEHCLKGDVLYRRQGYDEMSIQLINSPESVIHEGIATLAKATIFPGDEAVHWKAETLYPAIGIDRDPALDEQVERLDSALRGASGNGALMRHVDGASEDTVISYLSTYGLRTEEESRHRLRFIDDPLWRPYIFTYHVGRDLLGAWLDQAPEAERRERFRWLLTEQVTPSDIRSRIAA
jgi:hypothetical protein